MTKYTSTLTIMTLCLLLPKTNIAGAGSILIKEQTISSSTFDNSSNKETNQINDPYEKSDIIEFSEDATKSTEGLYDIHLDASKSSGNNLYESFEDTAQSNKISDYENIRNDIILDLIENKSILDDYDFSDYQNSLKELVDGKHLIPMKLISWKENIDNMVYENSNPMPSNYYVSDFEQSKNTNKKRRKKYNNTPSDWELFYHSKYYTWIRNIFIATLLIIILKDIIRSRRLKKSNSLRTARSSKYRRRK